MKISKSNILSSAPPALWQGNGFALLPWANYIREGRINSFQDGSFDVFPVIVAHCLGGDSAFPSMSRIAALAGVSKSTVINAVTWLDKYNWISVKRTILKNGRTKNIYIKI